MPLSLSKSEITSYCGDILPLHLGFDGKQHETLAKANIKWESDSDCVSVRSFSGNDATNFNNGVLLVLKKVGVSKITATYNGVCYTCNVTVREPITANSDDELDFFVGDLHNHTTKIHNHDEYIDRTSEFQYEFIEKVKKEGLLDFCAMSDHAVVLNDTDFFRNFIEVEKAEPNSVVIFPGAESEVTVLEDDRFGVTHKNSGEIVTFNTDGYFDCTEWKPFYEGINNSPEPIAIFAHPCTVGIGIKGIWNFCFHKNNNKKMINAIRGIETINGKAPQMNLMHEFNYSLALDSGFRISPVASSDHHGANWGYSYMKPKTVILAKEKSREAFIDALRNNRFYATESGNVKLRYSVNGKTAPADLDIASSYNFHVDISYFNDDETTNPVECSVISDGGKTLLTTNVTSEKLDFEIDSNTARYFYLRLTDREGRRTWSMPVWTGRPFDEYKEPILTPIDLSFAAAVDEISGENADSAIDGNISNVWETAGERASVLIDMKNVYNIRALGYYPRIVEKPARAIDPEEWAKWKEHDYTQTLPTKYEIHTSTDGKEFKKQAEGVFRIFGGENVVTFKKTKARYVRFKVNSTVGADALPNICDNRKCAIGNLTIFE